MPNIIPSFSISFKYSGKVPITARGLWLVRGGKHVNGLYQCDHSGLYQTENGQRHLQADKMVHYLNYMQWTPNAESLTLQGSSAGAWGARSNPLCLCLKKPSAPSDQPSNHMRHKHLPQFGFNIGKGAPRNLAKVKKLQPINPLVSELRACKCASKVRFVSLVVGLLQDNATVSSRCVSRAGAYVWKGRSGWLTPLGEALWENGQLQLSIPMKCKRAPPLPPSPGPATCTLLLDMLAADPDARPTAKQLEARVRCALEEDSYWCKTGRRWRHHNMETTSKASTPHPPKQF